MCCRSGKRDDKKEKRGGKKTGAEARVEGLGERKCGWARRKETIAATWTSGHVLPNPTQTWSLPSSNDRIHQLLTSVQPLLALAATAPLPFREAAQTCHAVTSDI